MSRQQASESDFEVITHEDVDRSSGSESGYDYCDVDVGKIPVQPGTAAGACSTKPAAITKSKVPMSDYQSDVEKMGLDVGTPCISNQFKEGKTAKMSTELISTNVNLLASVGLKTSSDSKTWNSKVPSSEVLKKAESNFREFGGRMKVLDSAKTVASSYSPPVKVEAPSELHSKSSGVNWERVAKPRDDRTGAQTHVAPITSSDDSKIYSDFMTRQFKLIKIKDIVENNNLLNDIEMRNPELCKYSKTSKTRKYYSKILDYFRYIIQESEDLFNNNICFLNEDELSPKLSKIFNQSRIPSSLLSQYELLITNLVKSFQQEYLERNRQIVRIENDLINQLLSQALGHFAGELKILQQKLLPPAQHDNLHKEIQRDIEQNFIKACGFKNSSWVQPTLSKLRSSLSHISKSLQFDGELEKLIKDSVVICLKTLKELQIGLTLEDKLQLVESNEKKARAAAFRNFVGSARKLTGEDNTQAYMEWKRRLDQNLDEAFKLKRADMLQAQRSSQMKQVLTRNSTTSHLCLPQKDLAIHFGLERTSVGIVGNRFQQILDAENCLYFHPDHILLSTEEAPRTCSTSKFSFERLLLNDPLGILYNVDAGEDLTSCRLEAILAMFFTKVKITAELKLRNEFKSCTIAVPQCLNTIQRTCVHDAATMAGFIPVTIVSDTTAAAVACMIEQSQIQKTITVATTLENLLDVASFDVENGIVCCHGISGMYFLQDWSLWDKLCHSRVVKSVASTFLVISNTSENLVRRIFSQDELNYPSTHPATCFIIGQGEISKLVHAETASNYQEICHLDNASILRGTSYISALLQPEETNCVKEHWIGYLNGRNPDLALKDFRDNLTCCDDKRGEKNTCNLPHGSNLSVEQLMAELKQFRGCQEIRNNASKLMALDLIVQTERSISSGHLDCEPDIKRHIHDRAIQLYGELKNDLVSNQKVEEICKELADLVNNFRMN